MYVFASTSPNAYMQLKIYYIANLSSPWQLSVARRSGLRTALE